MVPAVADHVTVWLVVLFTVALNCRVLPTRRDAFAGEIVTLMGGGGGGPVIVTDAVPVTAGVVLLVACTVTVAGLGTALGAVYIPPTESIKPTLEFPPTFPFTPHVTLWSLEPFTTALNCCCALTATAKTTEMANTQASLRRILFTTASQPHESVASYHLLAPRGTNPMRHTDLAEILSSGSYASEFH